MTAAMHPPSTAAEESRRLEQTFKILSLPQCRMLAAVRDLVRPMWWEAVNRARYTYGGGRRMSYATIRALMRYGLLLELELNTADGRNYRKLYELTKDGRMIEPMARSRLRKEGMA